MNEERKRRNTVSQPANQSTSQPTIATTHRPTVGQGTHNIPVHTRKHNRPGSNANQPTRRSHHQSRVRSQHRTVCGRRHRTHTHTHGHTRTLTHALPQHPTNHPSIHPPIQPRHQASQTCSMSWRAFGTTLNLHALVTGNSPFKSCMSSPV